MGTTKAHKSPFVSCEHWGPVVEMRRFLCLCSMPSDILQGLFRKAH